FFQAEDGIRDFHVTGVQTCALPILVPGCHVSISGFSSSAEVLEMPKKGSVRVMLGVMKMNVALTDIVAILPRSAQGSGPNKNTRSEERRVGKEWRPQRSTVPSKTQR